MSLESRAKTEPLVHSATLFFLMYFALSNILIEDLLCVGQYGRSLVYRVLYLVAMISSAWREKEDKLSSLRRLRIVIALQSNAAPLFSLERH